MQKVNFPMLLLAMSVVLMFCLVGISLYYENFLLIGLFTILGFLLMGYGISLKRKRNIEHGN